MQVPTRGKIGIDGSVMRNAHGAPSIELPPRWTGPDVQRFWIPRDEDRGPMYTGVPVLFSSTDGRGKRRYRSGVHVRDMDIGPCIDTYSARYERDFGRWETSSGTSIGIRFTPDCLDRLTSDRGHFDLDTRFDIVDVTLQRLVGDLAEELEGGLPNGRLYAEGLSLSLIGWLAAHYATRAPRQRTQTLSVRDQGAVRSFIDENLCADLSVTDLAGHLGMRADWFARRFKASFDTSPHQYVLRRRIEAAGVELQRGDRPLAEVALAYGFASQSHFTTVFRRTTGVTPGRFRAR